MRKSVFHITCWLLLLPLLGAARDFDFAETRDYLDARLSELNSSWLVRQGSQVQIEPAEVVPIGTSMSFVTNWILFPALFMAGTIRKRFDKWSNT